MKRQILKLVFLSCIVLSMNTKAKAQDKFFDRLIDNALILHEDGLVKGTQEVKGFLFDFDKIHGNVNFYESKFNIEVNAILDYELGEIHTNSKSFSVMFLKRKDENSRIEFLVIYKILEAENQVADLDKARAAWVDLCNAHRADQLVKRLYTADAYYYNRGRLLQGTTSITQEYSYMNNPEYSLMLTPKYTSIVTPKIAYEIGRCSGSYPLPYMLLWQKQTDGNWKILMDSNY